MKTVVEGLKSIFEAELNSSLDYIKEVRDWNLEDLVSRDNFRLPLINIEAVGVDDIDFMTCGDEKRNVDINIYLLFLIGVGINAQMGESSKNKVGYLKCFDDVISILKTNVQKAGSWTKINEITSSRLSKPIGTSQNVIGMTLSVNIERNL